MPFQKGNQLNKDKKFTAEHRAKLSEARKGKKPWNKGKVGVYSNEMLKSMSECRLDRKIHSKSRKQVLKKQMLGNKYAMKTGRIISTKGYVCLYMPEHPFAVNKGRYYQEHRYACECVLNRFLDHQETPHHINGIKDDNLPENLYLFPSRNSHDSYHRNLKNNNIEIITKSNLTDIG